MKYVMQTNTEEGKGNCFSACVASLLEVECDDIPNINDYPREWWFGALNKFLRERYNCCLLMVERPDGQVFLPNRVPFIVSAKVDKFSHAVIMEYRGPEPVLVHDPHPGRQGIEGDLHFMSFLLRLG